MARRLFDIRTEERGTAALLFAYIFLLIAALLIIKPVRNSLFLNEFGFDQLPYVFMLVAVIAGGTLSLYSRIATVLSLRGLITLTLTASILILTAVWLLLGIGYRAGWFIYAFYIWVALFGLMTTTQFWLLANYIFRARQAKRLFGLLGAGAIAGGITGGYLTKLLAPLIHTRNMVLISVSLVALALLVANILWSRNRSAIRRRMEQQRRVHHDQEQGHPLKLILKSRHLSLLAALVGLSVMVANLVDFQFSAIASEAIPAEDELTAFFGFWLSNLSLLSLFVQLGLTNRMLRSVGVGGTLYVLPLGILLGAIAILLAPALWSAVLIKVADGSLKQSVHKSGLELVALPIPAALKNRTKAFIDVFVDNLATGLGGLALVLMTGVLGMAVQQVSLLVIVLILIWLWVIHAVRREYVQGFRHAIEKRTLDFDQDLIDLRDPSVHTSLLAALESTSERRVLYALDLLEELPEDERFRERLLELLGHESNRVKAAALTRARQAADLDALQQARELLEKGDKDIQVAALRYLTERDEHGVEVLREALLVQEVERRSAAMLCAAEMIAEEDTSITIGDLRNSIQDIADTMRGRARTRQIIRLRRYVARAIGIVREPGLFMYLHLLLTDDHPDVLNEAVLAAGKTRALEFLPVLIAHLETRLVRRNARNALAQYGEEAVDLLAQHLGDPKERLSVRAAIPRVLSSIGTQSVVEILTGHLQEKDVVIRDQIVRALNRLKDARPKLRFPDDRIQETLHDQIRTYFSVLNALKVQRASMGESEHAPIRTARELLDRALGERLDGDLERIFRLLGLTYAQKEMHDAYRGVTSEREEARENAVEFLDNVLNHHLKKAILPMIEQQSLDGFAGDLPDEYAPDVFDSLEDSLVSLIEGDDAWLSACALYVARVERIALSEETLSVVQRSGEAIVLDAARDYIRHAALWNVGGDEG